MSRNRKSIQRGGTEGATIRNVVRTLLLNGYAIDSFARPATGASLLRVRKRDALGAEARTALLVLTRGVPTAGAPSIREISLSEFYSILGGEVRTDRILVPNLSNIMSELGHNRLPPSFSGKPDDLLEIYCEECLEFLLECPVRRYGQERRFEPLPDGLALGRNKFNLYFDAKAYGSEFHPTADDIRRFASYVKDFNLRYSSYVGPISLFVVISGSFSRDKNAINDKISEFQAECATPMAFIRALDLANLVSECANSIQNRAAINWRRVFAAQMFDVKRFRDELNRIRKDSVIR